MIYSVKFTCVLDTNVIYPLEVRDILFWFAHEGLYTPKWSQHIFDEWERVMRRHGVSEEQINTRIGWANRAFPDAMVRNYASLMDNLQLPDPKDRHVLAAAIKTNANLIVTNNLKDFPQEALAPYGLSAKAADDFLTDTIDLQNDVAIATFRKMVLNRTNPTMDEFAVLERLRKNGLVETADYLHALI